MTQFSHLSSYCNISVRQFPGSYTVKHITSMHIKSLTQSLMHFNRLHSQTVWFSFIITWIAIWEISTLHSLLRDYLPATSCKHKCSVLTKECNTFTFVKQPIANSTCMIPNNIKIGIFISCH